MTESNSESKGASAAKIVVIGGTGFYGSAAVDALERAGYDVTCAGRPPADERRPVAVDLTRPETFAALDGFDVIVNLADGVEAPADALVTWVTRNEKRYVECSAFAPFYRRTLAREFAAGGWTIVLGAGVFPGLSTGLALETAARLEGPPDAIDIAVRISPLSGAGWANCRLMARMLALPGYVWLHGARVEGPAVGESEEIDFPTGRSKAAVVDLPDLELVKMATSASSVRTRLGLKPGAFLLFFRLLAAIVKHSGPLRRPLLALLHWQLAFVRGLVLRDWKTSVEVVVRASRGDVVREESARWEEGREATARGIVLGVERAITENGLVIGVGERRS